MELETNLRLSLLTEIYKNLLTPKQQKMLKEFLDDNLSISELAEVYKTSRQAVNDLLKRTFKLLEDYENKLGLLKKFEIIRKNVSFCLNIFETEFNQNSSNCLEIEEQIKNKIIIQLNNILEVM